MNELAEYTNIEMNMNGEETYKSKYSRDFANKLSKKPDLFFENNELHSNIGRGSWVPGVENYLYRIEKQKRNL